MLKLCVARTSTPIRINKRAAAAGLALCLAAVAALPQCAMAQMRQAGHEASRHFTQDQAKIIRRTLASRSLTQPQTLYVVELECSDCLDYSSELIDIVAKVPGWEINKAMLIGYSGFAYDEDVPFRCRPYRWDWEANPIDNADAFVYRYTGQPVMRAFERIY